MAARPISAIALGALTERLAPVGLNLVGAFAADVFDKTQPPGKRVRERAPGCGTVVVVGNGGREFWQRMRHDTGEPNRAPHPSYRPIEERCAKMSRGLVTWLAGRGVTARAVCPQRDPALNFAQMAETAGLGVVSPVAEWLLHPNFGPWLSVRFALLVDGMPFGARFPRAVAGEYQPCAGCDRPCVRACPADVCGGGSVDGQRCATWQHGGGCTSGCGMKRACPVGTEHRFDAVEEAFRHAYNLLDLERRHGLGVWRFVPRGLRGG